MFIIDTDEIITSPDVKEYLFSMSVDTVWHGDFNGQFFVEGSDQAKAFTAHVIENRTFRKLNALIAIINECPCDVTWLLPFYDKNNDFGGIFHLNKTREVVTSRVSWVNDVTPIWVIDGDIFVTSQRRDKRSLAGEYLHQKKGLSVKEIVDMDLTVAPFNRCAADDEKSSYTFRLSESDVKRKTLLPLIAGLHRHHAKK